MAVANNNTFSLQDVVTELGITSNKSLTNCFAQASASLFDSNYSQLKDELDDFRNYNGKTTVIYTAFTITTASDPFGSGCSLSTASTQTKYFNGTGTYPDTIHTVYNDSSGNTVFNGLGESFRAGDGSRSFIISNTGTVNLVTIC